MLDKILKFINYNRWLIIGCAFAVIVVFGGIYCTPLTISPLFPTKMVDERGLSVDFKTWQAQSTIMQAKFEAAGEDLAEQKERNSKIEQAIVDVASGKIPDLPSALKVLLASGGLGAFYDNIRKRGLISGLKITAKNVNQTPASTA